MINVVTYDLNGPAGSYGPLFDALKRVGDSWWHYLRNTWLISTYKTPQQIFNEIHPYLHPADKVLIVPMGEGRWGTLPKDAWDWIDKHREQRSLPLSPFAQFSQK